MATEEFEIDETVVDCGEETDEQSREKNEETDRQTFNRGYKA
ncbi:hypothetical protein [Halopelagius longus]|nr:hypothetical protein [Halopelagius longus]